jgi:phage repressor protein C with HTH and peptisase S24 domain
MFDIKKFRTEKNITQIELAEILGVAQGFISEIERGRKNLPESKAKILKKRFGDISEYITKSIVVKKQSFQQNNEKSLVAIPNNDGIPLISVGAAAGVLSGEDVQVLEYECERFIVPTFKDAEFLMPVKGSSMLPKYNSGDIVACKRIHELLFFQWNKIYVLDTSQGVLIKRIHEDKENPDNVVLVSDNEKYQPFVIPKSDIRGIAIVIGVIRLE